MQTTKIIVIGAGVMGQGLAEAIASEGNEVTLLDKTTRLAEKGKKGIWLPTHTLDIAQDSLI